MTNAAEQQSRLPVTVARRTLCLWLMLMFPFGDTTAQAGAVSAQTRFDFVAVFPLATTSAQIEAWREQVLAQPHRHACLSGRPCVARMMRMALAGAAGREVIAFDLMRDAPAEERAAIIAAAHTELPGTALLFHTRPVDIDRIP